MNLMFASIEEPCYLLLSLNCHTLVKTKYQNRIAIIYLDLLLQNSISITYLNWPSFVQPLQEDTSTTRFIWTLTLKITQLANCRSNSRSWLEDGESIAFLLHSFPGLISVNFLTELVGLTPYIWTEPDWIDFRFKLIFLLLF